MAGYLAQLAPPAGFIDPPERIGRFVKGLARPRTRSWSILREAQDQLPEPLAQPGRRCSRPQRPPGKLSAVPAAGATRRERDRCSKTSTATI